MRRVLGVMAVTAMLVAGCGGNKKDVKASDSDDTTSTTLATDTTATTAAGGAVTTVAGGKTATTARGAATATTASGSSTGKAPVPTTPGTYDYAQSGTSTAGSVPPNGLLKVDPANASGIQVLHRQVDPSQPGSDTTVAFRADGPFITDTVTRQQQFEVRCHFDPPIAAPPWPATEGKPISGKADCGQIKVEVNGSITGHRTTKLDGADIEVVVATVTIKTTGQVESTTTETQWWAPSLRLTVHTESKSKGSFGAFPFESNVTSDLKSGKPR